MSKSKSGTKAGKAGRASKGTAAAPAATGTTGTAAAPAAGNITSAAETAAAHTPENNSGGTENSACIDAGTVAPLAAHSETVAPANNGTANPQQETTHMDRKLVLNTGKRKGDVAVYNVEGSPATIRINGRLFATKGQFPAELTLSGEGMAEAKQPKRKLTKEERAALPKPTAKELADRAAVTAKRAVERAQKLAAKANAA